MRMPPVKIMTRPEELNVGDILIPHGRIQGRLNEMAQDVIEDFRGKNGVMVGIGNGDLMITSDLSKKLGLRGFDMPIDHWTTDSYGTGEENSGQINVKMGKMKPEEFKDKDVLIVEDIIDSGLTLVDVIAKFQELGVRSLKILALLSKPSRRLVEMNADYLGFEINNIWVEGYGMDSGGHGRTNPHVVKGYLREESPPVEQIQVPLSISS